MAMKVSLCFVNNRVKPCQKSSNALMTLQLPRITAPHKTGCSTIATSMQPSPLRGDESLFRCAPHHKGQLPRQRRKKHNAGCTPLENNS